MDEKRKIAESLVEKMIIGNNEIDITFSYLPSSEDVCKNQQGLVAQLGISDRIIHTSRSDIAPNRPSRKPFPASIKTLGDYIRVKRAEKGFTQAQLAQMAGVVKATISRWERDVEFPDEHQAQLLESLLGLDSSLKPIKPNT
jgi:ribosome-binding protein aMBF1 (putative translation factor)